MVECVFSNFNGVCQYFDKDNLGAKPNGCDDEGYCFVEDDPNPADSCSDYEAIDDDQEEEEE